MYDDRGDELFGHDGRHHPPLIPRLLTAKGWKTSRGRLAFDKFNRAQDSNMSEYAFSTIGGLPPGYVIVNADIVDYDEQKAVKVGSHRVAIPVKEYARQHRLTTLEQWELMNPRWVGTYFGMQADNSFNGRKPLLKDAIRQAKDEDRYIEFAAMFWLAWDEHWEALNRIERRGRQLQEKTLRMSSNLFSLERKINQIESDIHYQRYDKNGENIFTLLSTLKYKHTYLLDEYQKTEQKARKIKEFIENTTL